MNLNMRNIPIPPDDTTMIVMPGKKPVDPAKKRDMALRCGVKSIKLRYKYNLTSTVGTSGFQPVFIMTQPRHGGGIDSVARWNVNEWTKEPLCERAMDFVPDEMEVGWAYLPDGPTNRVKLAYAEINNNALWEIDDKEVFKEIRELANEIQESVEFRLEREEEEQATTEVNVRVREEGIATGAELKSRTEIVNETLRDKIKELEQKDLQRDLLKRLAVLQGKESNGVKPDQVVANDKDKPAHECSVDVGKIELKKRAKAEVYSENAELIDSIKADHIEATGKTKGWAFTSSYRRQVEPLVAKRIEEIKDSEHTTIGGAT